MWSIGSLCAVFSLEMFYSIKHKAELWANALWVNEEAKDCCCSLAYMSGGFGCTLFSLKYPWKFYLILLHSTPQHHTAHGALFWKMTRFFLTSCLARSGLCLMGFHQKYTTRVLSAERRAKQRVASGTLLEHIVAPQWHHKRIGISSGPGADVRGGILGLQLFLSGSSLSSPDRECQRTINVFFAQFHTFRCNSQSRETFYCIFRSN